MPWDDERQEQSPPADNDVQEPQFTPPPYVTRLLAVPPSRRQPEAVL